MPYDENHEMIIGQYMQKLAKSREHYKKGMAFRLDLDIISKMTGIDFSKSRDSKEYLKEHPKLDSVINAFYKSRTR
ncbi:hypothetical protein [Candidatus Nitrosotalea okcheonensis]|uniref:Uncharacterized protein n=1 Tax=Candidatus Nitrosotalea okcheonensis TaxID=1903276 RepID=A0A2H1FHY4_9ARCH|nr:hypothetical protein [Candidatus Nitrosotalea okcheonensis]SMH72344.1 protein of unknown function [Candidatus Nitrosotalea okcheonensis]